MSKTRLTFCLAIILLCSTSIAFGYVIGSTNFDMFGYPEFSRKHIRPTPPYSRDSYSMSRYRTEVEDYLFQAKKYTEAANNDIDRIEEAKQDAIKAANEVVDEYNRFVKYGY
ncbi:MULTISPECIES: hypothetical protein [Sporomusa]|jgi:hypothetical protein|uniref:hypothetical protein n=1 Tax=Sporomusa TaxID=2375 RepID=UPI002BD46FB9|nr:hypothetical protein [Sporomusa sphaeroides]HML33908.1 hypothetical protein [Sporomusa sphaeroides]